MTGRVGPVVQSRWIESRGDMARLRRWSVCSTVSSGEVIAEIESVEAFSTSFSPDGERIVLGDYRNLASRWSTPIPARRS